MDELLEPVDIWILLERSAFPPATPVTRPKDDPAASGRPLLSRKWATRLWLCDGLGLGFWSYVLTKLFIADIDRVVVGAVAPSYLWALDYRFLFLLSLVGIMGIFLWRRVAILGAVYIILFPLIFLLIRLPWMIARRRSWLTTMATMHIVALLIHNFRFHLISKSLSLGAALAILTRDEPLVVMGASVILCVMFIWAILHVLKETFRANWYLRMQSKAIKSIVGSWFVRQFTEFDEFIPVQAPLPVLNSSQTQALVGKIGAALIINRSLYFWAFKLQSYRQSQIVSIIATFTYTRLFISSVLVIWLVNTALLKVDPSQFTYHDYPSGLEMLLYGLSTLALSDAAGVAADGSIAIALGIFAGLYGVLFLAVFLANLVMAVWRDRDDFALRATVSELKSRAREHEAQLRTELQVSVVEAQRRLEALGQHVGWIMSYLVSQIPPDFFEDEPSTP